MAVENMWLLVGEPMVVRKRDNLLVRGWMEMNVVSPLGALCPWNLACGVEERSFRL